MSVSVQAEASLVSDHFEEVRKSAPRGRVAKIASHADPLPTRESVESPSGFDLIGLSPAIARALAEEGYATPTPIQSQAIPAVMAGRDLLGCAQTGTGKTAAFALPILHRLVTAPADKSRRGATLPRVLVLSPTRELATQIGESFATYGRHTAVTGTTVFGGVSQVNQVRALRRGVDVLVATPGRLMDLMQQGCCDLSAVEVFVLDEADRMLDMGFIQPIRRIASALPKARQTLLFSATMPREIAGLAESLLRDPARVSVTPVSSAAPKIEQLVYMIDRGRKPALLEHLIRSEKIGRALVFTRTKRGADVVARRLNDAGIVSTAIHGNKAQNQRTRALDGLRSGRVRILVATDVAARGIDVDGITHVINYDMPVEAEAYVHRIGRTGRAGATGIAIALCGDDERPLLRDIERLLGRRVRVADPVADLPHAPARAVSHDERPVRPDSRGHDARQGGSGRSGRGGDRSSGGERSSQQRPRSRSAPRGGHGSGTASAPRSGSGHVHSPGHSGSHPRRANPAASGPRTTMSHFRGKTRRSGGR
ncbi:MAG: DEAD/DEAH box helicase [Phycisphaeraceae bacterium]|nr:DEAD/DEAH box helicase [Phycisphaerae bacterium]MBX3392020.1 DEAD/DEAH box helicase [Phycisphaeraceae bacterium]